MWKYLLPFFALAIVQVQGLADTQTRSAGVAFSHNSDGQGIYNWTNPSGATGAGTPARFFGGGGASYFLELADFDFDIPAGATVNGIEVSFRKRGSQLDSDLLFTDWFVGGKGVRLVKAGAVHGADRGTWDFHPTTVTWVDHGSASDLWGGTWNAAAINAINFGTRIRVNGNSPEGAFGFGEISGCEITVTYTP
jgi:hypothetical protein